VEVNVQSKIDSSTSVRVAMCFTLVSMIHYTRIALVACRLSVSWLARRHATAELSGSFAAWRSIETRTVAQGTSAS